MKKNFQLFLLCGMFAWCVIDIAHAIAPPDPDVYDVGDVGVVTSTSTARVGVRAKIKAPRPPHYVTTSPRLTSTTGAAKPLIILIEFLGTRHSSSHTTTYFQNLVFSTTSLSLAGYYQENSGSVFHVTNATTTNPHDWLESDKFMLDYGRDGSDIDNSSGPIWRLAKEAVEKLDATGFDFSPFVNQSGIVENVIIVHAGGAQESSGYSTDIWSHQWEIDDGRGVTVNGGYKIVQYTMLSEDSPLGIFCHEFGHTLGLPDLYDTSVFGGLKVVGTWCLMDYGSWIDSGNHPSHISGWGKTYLQWGNTVSVQGKQGNNLPLYPSSEMSQTQTPTFYKIPILGSQTEYFLLEYRRNNGSTVYDVDIATSGIVVWHVDEDKWNEVINGTTRWDENTINTDAKHRSVSVVQAQTGSIGSVTDVFGWNVYDLIPSKSNGYRGSSDMVVTDMMGAGTRVMTLNISPYSPQSQLIVTLYNYPNPVNTNTTIHIVTSKFVLKGALRIYTLSGELVYDEDVDGEKYTHTKSSENASVYEFVWDGTNLHGERLASGVYFCVFSADGAHRSAKIAVIR